MHMTPKNTTILAAGLLLLALPGTAFAYGGPGLGLGAAATALGVVGAILLALISVLWYPFKRLIRRIRGGGSAR
jgi:hypothetical protein